ncbi:MAG: hypothetical protein ACK5NE_08550 [Brachymonas sp.]
MKTKHREAAKQKRQQREQQTEPEVGGTYGRTFDVYTGLIRGWYQNHGDVKRWADNDQPVEAVNL